MKPELHRFYVIPNYIYSCNKCFFYFSITWRVCVSFDSCIPSMGKELMKKTFILICVILGTVTNSSCLYLMVHGGHFDLYLENYSTFVFMLIMMNIVGISLCSFLWFIILSLFKVVIGYISNI